MAAFSSGGDEVELGGGGSVEIFGVDALDAAHTFRATDAGGVGCVFGQDRRRLILKLGLGLKLGMGGKI